MYKFVQWEPTPINDSSSSVFEYFPFLVPDITGSSYMFCAPILELAISPMSPGSFNGCYKLIYPPKIHMLKPTSQCDGIWAWILGRQLGLDEVIRVESS